MGKLLTDETGKLIVNAINNSEITQQRIAEINASAENAKQSALDEIQAVKDTIPADYSSLNDDMLMLMSSLKRTATGTNIVNITNTAENGILKVTANGDVTCKNKNMFEDILTNSIYKANCKVSYDNGTYTVEYIGSESSTFFFGNTVGAGGTYNVALGKKLKYYKNLSIRINCDKLTRLGCYITYFNANNAYLSSLKIKTNTTYKIDDVEGAEYFTMRIGFDYNSGAFTTGDIVNFSVQIEYGDAVSDYVVPQSNTDNLSYEGVTNIVGGGDITVEYVENLKTYIDNKINEVATAVVAHESEVN